jgi:hypothetical protein
MATSNTLIEPKRLNQALIVICSSFLEKVDHLIFVWDAEIKLASMPFQAWLDDASAFIY